jgi:hypothetical protein
MPRRGAVSTSLTINPPDLHLSSTPPSELRRRIVALQFRGQPIEFDLECCFPPKLVVSIPNTRFNRVRSNRELAGLLALVG